MQKKAKIYVNFGEIILLFSLKTVSLQKLTNGLHFYIMIAYTEIKDINHPLFIKAWLLYRNSFPSDERRELRAQRKIMSHPAYHFEVITEEYLFVGFILWWQFEDMCYIEHFATSPALRGKGQGHTILEQFIAKSEVPLILEVEHPTEPIKQRRIGFYQRLGFVLNNHHYVQPPYKKRGDALNLLLMTYPNAISTQDVVHFCTQYHPIIHSWVLAKERVR